MRLERLTPGEPLPALVRPAGGDRDLVAFARSHREEIRLQAREQGALLFRGFDLREAGQFQDFCSALSNELLDYSERSTPRKSVEGKVYTSTEYPSTEAIPLHGEMSYATRWPRLLWFFSQVPAGEGGETPICDARRVHERVSPVLRERFQTRGGVQYVRTFNPGFDLPWQEVYGVETREELEAYCRAAGIAFEWRADGGLTTRSTAPAVARHPETGEAVWFNQAHLFHPSNLKPDIRRYLVSKLGEAGLPRNALYGDGSPLEEETLDQIRGAYQQSELVFSWEQGDVLMADNMLVSHGRRPFRGPRKTLVVMAENFRRA